MLQCGNGGVAGRWAGASTQGSAGLRKQESTTTLVNAGKTVDGGFRGEEDIEAEAVVAGKAKIHCPGDIQKGLVMVRNQFQEWPARSRHWQNRRITPFWINDGESIGLGDAVKDLTTLAGIPPCSGCEQRAAFLNRLLRLPRFRSRNRS